MKNTFENFILKNLKKKQENVILIKSPVKFCLKKREKVKTKIL